MKTLSLIVSLFLPLFIFAQVGVGTTNPNAQLHVDTEATIASERRGIQVNLNNTSTAQQNTYSLHLTNSTSPSLIAAKYGIFNNVSGLGTATRYGIYTEVFKPNTGALTTDMYGVYSRIGQATGVTSNSYGLYADLTNAGNTGNIFGVYSTVNGSSGNTNIYSGYFLGGKFSIGQTIADNYILPESRGADGQIMETDAAGNVTWVDNVNPVSTIPIYTQHDGIGYVMNNTARMDLGLMDSSLDPTVYNAAGNIQVKLVVRYVNNTAGIVNLELRAHDGITETYAITTASAWTFATTQNGGIATSGWENFNAGTRAHEVHVNAWVSNNDVTILNAYLLVRSQ